MEASDVRTVEMTVVWSGVHGPAGALACPIQVGWSAWVVRRVARTIVPFGTAWPQSRPGQADRHSNSARQQRNASPPPPHRHRQQLAAHAHRNGAGLVGLAPRM